MDINPNGFRGDAVTGGSYLKKANLVNQRISAEVARKYFKGHVADDLVNDHFYDIERVDPFWY